MKLIKALIPAWIVVAANAVFCLWAHTRLPEGLIATHFDAHMHANGWMSRDNALLVPWCITVVILALLTVAPYILPPRGALERSAKAYGAVCFAMAAFLFATQLGMVAQPLGLPFGVGQTIPVMLGLFLLIVGNFATKVRPNFIYGVRTPWTLSNEAVWDKTHRFAGPALMAGGLFIAVGGSLWPVQLPLIILGGAVAPGLLAAGYSYWLWRQLPPDEKRRIRVGA